MFNIEERAMRQALQDTFQSYLSPCLTQILYGEEYMEELSFNPTLVRV